MQDTTKKSGKGWKIAGGIAAAILVIGIASNSGDTDTTSPAAPAAASATSQGADTSHAAQPVDNTPDVPREWEQALKSAESYLSFSAFSYDGLYQQLTSQYGEGYPADAAQYAVDTVDVDWNEQAVKSAESYLSFTSFSRDGLYQQLTSEYGEGFTPEQAQHAIDTVY